MILTRTPFRISFFGGGTDYPAYYREFGGAVLSTTINKYCHIACRALPPFFDHKYVIRYSNNEYVNTIDDINHPSVREALRYFGIASGVEIVHSGDIPARSGVGSSSAFTVGLLHALSALTGRIASKRQLARTALHLEQNVIKENVGSQDQVAAAFGGLNKISFSASQDFYVSPVVIKPETMNLLQQHLMLIFTGQSRTASSVASEQIKTIPAKLSELQTMCEMVDAAVEILAAGSPKLREFGRLLDESWRLKRSLTKLISNSEIDDLYDAAKSAGALGGKLCGAGKGGFMLLFVPPENQQKVKAKLKGYLHVPFGFDFLGTQVVSYSTQDYIVEDGQVSAETAHSHFFSRNFGRAPEAGSTN